MNEQLIQTTLPAQTHASRGNTIIGGDSLALPLALRAQNRFGRWDRPMALVSSSEETIQQTLADCVVQFRVTVLRAFTVGESRRILSCLGVCLIVSADRLIDGSYQDILDQANRLDLRAPLIVASPTGDWPEYLEAMARGVFDYLAYPPLSPDFSRVIRHALASTTSISERMAG